MHRNRLRVGGCGAAREDAMIAPDLLEILACPACVQKGPGHGKLRLDEKAEKLICEECGLRFGILEGGIPNMLLDEAEKPE